MVLKASKPNGEEIVEIAWAVGLCKYSVANAIFIITKIANQIRSETIPKYFTYILFLDNDVVSELKMEVELKCQLFNISH